MLAESDWLSGVFFNGVLRAGLCTRRLLLRVVITIFFVSACIPSLASIQQIKPASIQEKLSALEASSGGRIGLSAVDAANNIRLQYRAEERFPMCSTYKVMGVAAILKKSMTDNHLLQQKVTYRKENLVVYSPITKKHIAKGMRISELCAAAMMQSDNTAINLLMKKLGGPGAVNAFAHSIGDHTFRLDRWEPELNSAIPGDLRDTSTPAAMQRTSR